WLDYADPAVAPIRRSSSGPIAAIIRWLDYADPGMARICRSVTDGMCLLMKRLEKGHFVWPQADSGVICLSPAQLSMLLEGIDWRQPTRTVRPTSAL
ncbi:IS66 family insertion sequence element accessory protein TnpB, partial [Burkholderia sp. JPY481]